MDNQSDIQIVNSLSTISAGASFHYMGKIIKKLLQFVFNFILSRGLGASGYGIYSYAVSIVSILIVFFRFGSGKSLLRFLPEYQNDKPQQVKYLGLAYLTTIVSGVIAGILLYGLAPLISAVTINSMLFENSIRIFSILLPFNIIINITSEVFRALEKMKYKVYIQNILNPLVKIFTAGVAMILGYSLLGVISAIAIGTILVFMISISLLFKYSELHMKMISKPTKNDIVQYYKFSLPLTFQDVGSIFYRRIDILMIGFFLSEVSVGVYQISILIATLLVLPLEGVNQLFPPIASKLNVNSQMNDLEYVYEFVTRWSFTMSFPIGLILIIYSHDILSIFGPKFTIGAKVLAVYSIGQLANTAVGPSGYLLMMTNHQNLTMINQWILGIFNVMLNYILILEFGLIGAAIATTSVLIAINMLRVIEVWYTEKLHPYSASFWKPIFSGTITGIVLILTDYLLSGFISLIVGTIIGFGLYIVTMLVIGVGRRDREIIEEIINEYI